MRSGFSDVRTADVAPAKPKFLTDEELVEIIEKERVALAASDHHDDD